MRWLLLLSTCLFAIALTACGDYPRDPEGTSDRVRGGVLRVGVSDDPPFVVADGGEPRGREANLIRGFARSQRARIAWNRRGHSALMRQLQRHQLDAVIGGHAPDSPWTMHVASARPYAMADAHGRLVQRAIALPPGENAWLLAFDRYARSPEARVLREGDAR